MTARHRVPTTDLLQSLDQLQEVSYLTHQPPASVTGLPSDTPLETLLSRLEAAPSGQWLKAGRKLVRRELRHALHGC